MKPRHIFALAVSLSACSDSLAGGGRQAELAIGASFPSTYKAGVFGLPVDRARIRLIRPPAQQLVDTTVGFPADQNEIQIHLKVPLLSRHEVLLVGMELSSGSRLLFAGTLNVEVSDQVSTAPTIPLQYVGPGTEMTSLRIEPRDSALMPGASFTYRVQAFAGQAPVQDFYVAWGTSDPEHVPVNAVGSLTVPASRGGLTLRVVSPTGVEDSTRIWVSPPAIDLRYESGNEQTSAAGSQLPAFLVVKTLAADGLGVPGTRVHFHALSGGSVHDSVVVTDANGIAQTAAKLGPLSGLQLYEASATGLPTVTFNEHALAGPPFRLKVIAGNNQTGTVGQVLQGAFVAQVTDAVGNIIAGVPLSWQVLTGNGTLEQVDTQTNLSGVALALFRLGTLPGTNVVRVHGTTVLLSGDFTAIGVPGPANILDPVAGDNQTGAPGATLGAFVVQVTDEFGNPLPVIAVHWSEVEGGGGLSAVQTTTDVSGRTSVTYRLPDSAGVVHVTAQVPGTSLSFTFTAVAAVPPTKSPTH